LRINLFYSIVYYLQSDDQSEQSNQIIKIIFRYYFIANSEADWKRFAIRFRDIFNNFKNILTRKFSNKFIYRKIFCKELSIIDFYRQNTDYAAKQKKNQIEIATSIVFANAKIKLYYNSCYQLFALRKKDRIFLKLYSEYKISKLKNFKFFNQKAKSFKIQKIYNYFVFKLKLLSNWKIYSVISIVILKLVSKKSNLYAREIDANAFSIKKDKKTNNNYKIQRLLNRRVMLQKRDFCRKKIVQYFVK